MRDWYVTVFKTRASINEMTEMLMKMPENEAESSKNLDEFEFRFVEFLDAPTVETLQNIKHIAELILDHFTAKLM